LRENPNVDQKNMEILINIIKRDIESEKEIQRYSELWAIVDGIEGENQEQTKRLLNIITFLIDCLTYHIKKEKNVGKNLN
jgi:hypothetical protein